MKVEHTRFLIGFQDPQIWQAISTFKTSFGSHSNKLKEQLTRLPWWVPMVVHGRKDIRMSRLQSRILSRKKFIDGSKYIF
jgi:hypothetical protein